MTWWDYSDTGKRNRTREATRDAMKLRAQRVGVRTPWGVRCTGQEVWQDTAGGADSRRAERAGSCCRRANLTPGE